MTTAEWTRAAEARLRAAGIVEGSRTEARVLAAAALGCDASGVLAHPERPFPTETGEAILRRREAREPLAYILGRREFYGRTFAVGPGALVPRHETETLVEVALERPLPASARALDVGAGSGCVGITLALERPDWRVTAVDLSGGALAWARRNAGNLGADIELIEGDLLPPGRTFDLIVSNPPYVSPDDPLPPEVRGWEPPEALYGGADGLTFYRRLADEARGAMNDGGWMVVEVGRGQAEEVRAIWSEHGWREIAIRRDLAGIERVVSARHT